MPIPPKKAPKRAQPQKRMVHFQIRDRLHTDILEEKYGPIRARVIRHDNQVRAAHLVDGKGISRTFAITFFSPLPKKTEIAAINEQIKRGKPIGKAFREHGYAIRKNVLAVFVVPIPKWLQQAFGLQNASAKVRVSEFFAKKEGTEPFVYGKVAEIYSPDFRPAVINAIDRGQINPSAEALEKSGFSKEEIWRRLGAYNEWGDVKKQYQQAKAKTRKERKDWQEKIARFLQKQ
jgi:hypothetical protein